jgi:superfamily II DNA or RNA helicase
LCNAIERNMELRDYQVEAISGVRESYRKGNTRVLMQQPTGAGKTVTFSWIANQTVRNGKRVLILVHRNELIEQSSKTLTRYGLEVGVIAAGYKPQPDLPAQVASVQTLVRRLNKDWCDPDLIITDECHHATASTYQAIGERFPRARHLGVTATPIRLDGKGLADIYQDLVHGLQVGELVERGSLVPPRYITTPGEIDLSQVKITAGDYNKRQLIQAVRQAQINGDLIQHWQKYAEGLQTIVFCVDIEHAIEVLREYEAIGVSSAVIDGKTPPDIRRSLIEEFRNKQKLVLINVGIFTEGFDLPSIACVQLARPTKSVSLYYQMIGRALRPEEGKTEAIILDHAGLFHDMGSVTDPVRWELNTTKFKTKKQLDEEAAAEEEKMRGKARIIDFDGTVLLVPVPEGNNDWLKDLDFLIKRSQNEGYKKAWVVNEFKRLYSTPTEVQMKTLGRALGYHHRWHLNQLGIAPKIPERRFYAS